MEIEQKCEADGAVGAAFMVVAALGAGAIILLWDMLAKVMEASSRAFSTDSPNTVLNSDGVMQAPPSNPAPTLAMLALLLFCGLLFVAGYGVRDGRKKSFDMAIVLLAILCFTSGGAAIFAVAGLVYCVLRRARLVPVVRP